MKQATLLLSICFGIGALTVTYSFSNEFGHVQPANRQLLKAPDTLKLPGMVLTVPSSWKKSIGSSAYGYETALTRFPNGMQWNNSYNMDKKGWGWYLQLPLANWCKMDFEMSSYAADGFYMNKKKRVPYSSLADLKGAYNESLWKRNVVGIGEPMVTTTDTTLNGTQAVITHVSYMTKGFGTDFITRFEARENYTLLFWSETLKKPIIFKMIFKIYEFVGHAPSEEKYTQIFMDEIRKKDSEMTKYFKSFLGDIETK